MKPKLVSLKIPTKMTNLQIAYEKKKTQLTKSEIQEQTLPPTLYKDKKDYTRKL